MTGQGRAGPAGPPAGRGSGGHCLDPGALAPPLQALYAEAFDRARRLYETAERRHSPASVDETASRVAWSAVTNAEAAHAALPYRT